MAFVNEYIPAADMEKYQIKEIDKRVSLHGRTHAKDWTIDRDRNMYLRNVKNGTFEFSYQSAWTFFWHGELLWVELEILGTSSGRNVPSWGRKRVTLLCVMGAGSNHLPSHLEPQKAQILKDLEEALLAYKDGGVYASATSYELFLEIAEGGVIMAYTHDEAMWFVWPSTDRAQRRTTLMLQKGILRVPD